MEVLIIVYIPMAKSNTLPLCHKPCSSQANFREKFSSSGQSVICMGIMDLCVCVCVCVCMYACACVWLVSCPDLGSSPLPDGLATQVQKLVSSAYIPGGSNDITGFAIITPNNTITV